LVRLLGCFSFILFRFPLAFIISALAQPDACWDCGLFFLTLSGPDLCDSFFFRRLVALRASTVLELPSPPRKSTVTNPGPPTLFFFFYALFETPFSPFFSRLISLCCLLWHFFVKILMLVMLAPWHHQMLSKLGAVSRSASACFFFSLLLATVQFASPLSGLSSQHREASLTSPIHYF